jgi:AraC-like DNA-binding protein
MNNYYKYLPVSKDDENWGLTVLNAGCTRIAGGREYPSKTHPEHHNFNWGSGRTLQEYQVIYITNGQGIFESESQKQTVVKAGTILFLFPNERHRYKPDEQTGWDEYWIGIKGNIIENLVTSGYIRPENACFYIGFHKELLDIFHTIIENTKTELPGYQPRISGAALHLLGIIHSISKQNTLEKSGDAIISKAQLLFRANISNAYSPEQAAHELGVGYSWFRKHFKDYTGLSPGQYYLQLKIEQAKNQLATSDCPVKEIAYNLNFDSAFYFSKIFKEKTGLKPTEYRSRSQQTGRFTGDTRL